MNIIFSDWLDNNNSNKDIISESFNFDKKQQLSEEKLEKLENKNTNLKRTINDLDKKIQSLINENNTYKSIVQSLINENNAYKGIVQILLFFSVVGNIIIYSKTKN